MYILLGYFTLSIYINIHKENHFKNMKSHENYALKLVTRTCTPSPPSFPKFSWCFFTNRYLHRSMVRALFLWADDISLPLTHADFASIFKRLSDRVPPVAVLTIFGIREYGLVSINYIHFPWMWIISFL